MAHIRVRGMPALIALVVAAAVAVFARAEARQPDYYHPSTFTVTGKVQCQDCTKDWNTYAYNGKPIPGSKVSITCWDDRRRVVYHGTDATDGQGVFNLEVPSKARTGCAIAPSRCTVRLASSGDARCAVFTDFNRGGTGQTPSRLTHASPSRVTYSVGPYYFTLRQCDVKVGKDDDQNAGY